MNAPPRLVLAFPCMAACAAPALVPYVAPSRLFALHRPAGWTVTEEPGEAAFAIQVAAPDGASRVRMAWNRRTGGGALDALRAALARERREHPGASLGEIRASRDGARAVAALRYREGGGEVAGRIFVEAEGRGISVQVYAAPVARLDALRPTLLNVMLSVAFIRPPRAEEKASRPLEERRAPDGSVRLRLPREWTFLAAKGTVLAGEPGTGFIATAFSGNPMLPQASVLQGIVGRPYLAPAQALPAVLAGFGNRNIQVLSHAPDPAAVARYQAQVGRPGEAAEVVATWISREGLACLGAFKIINGKPVVMGQWSCLVMGIWAPRDALGRVLPLLEEVAASYGVDDRYAKQYIQEGLARLRRMQAETSRAMKELAYAREDQQRAWEDRQARKDYMDSRWDDYRRGNSYWVSDLEGGKVYRTDPHGTRDTATGDYYEGSGYTWTDFEGRNPRHTQETMREISSYELEHGRPPRP